MTIKVLGKQSLNFISREDQANVYTHMLDVRSLAASGAQDTDDDDVLISKILFLYRSPFFVWWVAIDHHLYSGSQC